MSTTWQSGIPEQMFGRLKRPGSLHGDGKDVKVREFNIKGTLTGRFNASSPNKGNEPKSK